MRRKGLLTTPYLGAKKVLGGVYSEDGVKVSNKRR
jgi:hypothetical protein